MSESSMVCNGHKEKGIEKCINAVSELFHYDKVNCERANSTEAKSKDSMTIGSIPFPDFDHLYASSVEETGGANSVNMNVARSNLNSYHLNIIEEQAKLIDTQNQEIIKLKKQNDSLVARIERMNRRLSLSQCNRNTDSCPTKYPFREGNDPLEGCENTVNCSGSEKLADDSQSDDVPLIKLTPFCKENDTENCNLTCGVSNTIETRDTNPSSAEKCSDTGKGAAEGCQTSRENCKSNFRIKFRRSELSFNRDGRKRNKMVRFVEAKRRSSAPPVTTEKLKRNCAKTVDEKLKLDDAVLFLKTTLDEPAEQLVVENRGGEVAESEDASSTQKKKSFKFPILTTAEPFYTSVREDTSHMYDPVTYTPTALEVPSFRMVDRDSIEPPDVPKDYFEDVTIEAAKERHLRFEIGERKRKKWDVQRIRELRQNERLKEKLRRRKSRWNKLESAKQSTSEEPEQVSTLFPDIKCIEKILITDAVPVTALGTSIPKIPCWGSDFHTEWMNDGSVGISQYEENQPALAHHHHHHHHHNKDSRSKAA